MRTVQYYAEHADDLAQRVLDTWESIDKPASPEFQALFDKASQYLVAKRVADKRHGQPDLVGPDETEENAAQLAFAEAYKAFDDRRGIPGA